MKNLFLAAITVAAMTVSGCGSDDVKCSDKGNCAQDSTPSATYVTGCQAMLASTCGSQFQAVLNCVKANEKMRLQRKYGFDRHRIRLSNAVWQLRGLLFGEPDGGRLHQQRRALALHGLPSVANIA